MGKTWVDCAKTLDITLYLSDRETFVTMFVFQVAMYIFDHYAYLDLHSLVRTNKRIALPGLQWEPRGHDSGFSVSVFDMTIIR